MIIDNFHFVGLSLAPAEADPPLVVDLDTVLAIALAAKLLEAISWREPQVIQCFGGIKHAQLSQGRSLQVERPPSDGLPIEQALTITVEKAPNQREAS